MFGRNYCFNKTNLEESLIFRIDGVRCNWHCLILCSDRHFSFIVYEHNILSVQTQNTRHIFLTAGKQKQLIVSSTLLLVWWLKLVPNKFGKNGKQLNVAKGLTSVQQERRPVADRRSYFWFQSGFSQKDEAEKFDKSEKFIEIFVLFICRC